MSAPGSDRVLDRLGRLHPKLIDLSLGRVERLLAALGDPQDRLPPVIHIAGTNGQVTLFGMVEAVRAVLAHIFNWYTVTGWTSLIVTICVIGGSLLVSIGVLGEYVGKLYEQSKGRPLYLVARTVNLGAAKPEHAAEPLHKGEHA